MICFHLSYINSDCRTLIHRISIWKDWEKPYCFFHGKQNTDEWNILYFWLLLSLVLVVHSTLKYFSLVYRESHIDKAIIFNYKGYNLQMFQLGQRVSSLFYLYILEPLGFSRLKKTTPGKSDCSFVGGNFSRIKLLYQSQELWSARRSTVLFYQHLFEEWVRVFIVWSARLVSRKMREDTKLSSGGEKQPGQIKGTAPNCVVLRSPWRLMGRFWLAARGRLEKILGGKSIRYEQSAAVAGLSKTNFLFKLFLWRWHLHVPFFSIFSIKQQLAT